jgi:hypothetical protein
MPDVGFTFSVPFLECPPMEKKFSTTISGSISQDPTTNKITLEFDGIPAADMAAFTAWLTDWIPVVAAPVMPAATAKGK